MTESGTLDSWNKWWEISSFPNHRSVVVFCLFRLLMPEISWHKTFLLLSFNCYTWDYCKPFGLIYQLICHPRYAEPNIQWKFANASSPQSSASTLFFRAIEKPLIIGQCICFRFLNHFTWSVLTWCYGSCISYTLFCKGSYKFCNTIIIYNFSSHYNINPYLLTFNLQLQN